MPKRVLIALDGSRGSWRAVEFAASAFAREPGLRVELLHVLPEKPSYYWDFGHIPGRKEEAAARRLADAWQTRQESRWQDLQRRALKRLILSGIPESSISNKYVHTDRGVADGILREAEAGRFDVVVLGRRGMGPARALLLGSVSLAVVQRARGRAVIVAE